MSHSQLPAPPASNQRYTEQSPKPPAYSTQWAQTCRPTDPPILLDIPLTIHTDKPAYCPCCGERTYQQQWAAVDAFHYQALQAGVSYKAYTATLKTMSQAFTKDSYHKPLMRSKRPNPNSENHDTKIAFEQFVGTLVHSDTTQHCIKTINIACHRCGLVAQVKHACQDEPATNSALSASRPVPPVDAPKTCRQSEDACYWCPFCGTEIEEWAEHSRDTAYSVGFAYRVLAEVTTYPVPMLQKLYTLWLGDSAFNEPRSFHEFLTLLKNKMQQEINVWQENRQAVQ